MSEPLSAETKQTIIQAMMGDLNAQRFLTGMIATGIQQLAANATTEDFLELLLCMAATNKQNQPTNAPQALVATPIKSSIELIQGAVVVQCWQSLDASDVVARSLTDREMALLQRFFDQRRTEKK